VLFDLGDCVFFRNIGVGLCRAFEGVLESLILFVDLLQSLDMEKRGGKS
jgi:hypothetical protein